MFRSIKRFFVARAYDRISREVSATQRRLVYLETEYASIGPRDDLVAEIAHENSRLDALLDERDYVRAKLIELS